MAIMPGLKSLFEISRGRPDVSFFEGQEGLKTVLNTILVEAKEICILGEGESFLNAIPEWNEAYVSKSAGKKIKVKLILKATPFALKSIKKMQESPSNEFLKIRVLPEHYKINHGGFDLYNNKSITGRIAHWMGDSKWIPFKKIPRSALFNRLVLSDEVSLSYRTKLKTETVSA